jgi:hypothetical protein
MKAKPGAFKVYTAIANIYGIDLLKLYNRKRIKKNVQDLERDIKNHQVLEMRPLLYIYTRNVFVPELAEYFESMDDEDRQHMLEDSLLNRKCPDFFRSFVLKHQLSYGRYVWSPIPYKGEFKPTKHLIEELKRVFRDLDGTLLSDMVRELLITHEVFHPDLKEKKIIL